MSQLLGSWGLVARAYMVQVWTLRVMIRGEEKPENSLGGGAGGRHLRPCLDAQERATGSTYWLKNRVSPGGQLWGRCWCCQRGFLSGP